MQDVLSANPRNKQIVLERCFTPSSWNFLVQELSGYFLEAITIPVKANFSSNRFLICFGEIFQHSKKSQSPPESMNCCNDHANGGRNAWGTPIHLWLSLLIFDQLHRRMLRCPAYKSNVVAGVAVLDVATSHRTQTLVRVPLSIPTSFLSATPCHSTCLSTTWLIVDY